MLDDFADILGTHDASARFSNDDDCFSRRVSLAAALMIEEAREVVMPPASRRHWFNFYKFMAARDYRARLSLRRLLLTYKCNALTITCLRHMLCFDAAVMTFSADNAGFTIVLRPDASDNNVPAQGAYLLPECDARSRSIYIL